MLWLIGMMGAGKSTIGHLVARATQLPFVDLDHVIEAAAAMSVSDVFASFGEPGFRERESAALREVAAGAPSVVATGGGVVLAADNVARMRACGLVVWLEATVPTLVGRTEVGADRPLLVDTNIEERLADLLRSRAGAYSSAAHARISNDDKDPDEVAVEVSRLWLAS